MGSGLSGSLKAIKLTTLLQMISADQSSGMLKVTSGPKAYEILFSAGRIVNSKKWMKNKSIRAEDILHMRGLISDTQVIEIRQKVKATAMTVETILVNEEIITTDRLAEVLRLQTQEDMFDVLIWREGDYEFLPGKVEFDPNLYQTISVDGVMMEGMRIADDLPRTISHLGSLEAVPRKKIADENLTDAHMKMLNSLKEDQQKLYQLIDGGLTIRQLGLHSGMVALDAYQAIEGLLKNKIILITQPKSERVEIGEGTSTVIESVAKGRIISVVMLLAVILAVAGSIIFSGFSVTDTFGSGGASGRDWLQIYASTNQLERIKNAVEIYRLEKGVAPRSLAELVEFSLLFESDLRFPYEEEYYYKNLGEDKYMLLKPAK